MPKRRSKEDEREEDSSNKLLKRQNEEFDFLRWAEEHRPLDTFLAPHLSLVDLVVLRLSCKRLNSLLKKKPIGQTTVTDPSKDKGKNVLNKPVIVSSLDLAIRFGHFRLAVWFIDRGYYFYHSDEPEKAGIFRPFGHQEKEQKMLLDRLVFKNKDCPKSYYCHIAHWGNKDLAKKMFSKSRNKQSLSTIVYNAAFQGHVFILKMVEDIELLKTAWGPAASGGRIGVLNWLLDKRIPLSYFEGKKVYFSMNYKANSLEERSKRLKEWVKYNAYHLVVNEEDATISRRYN